MSHATASKCLLKISRICPITQYIDKCKYQSISQTMSKLQQKTQRSSQPQLKNLCDCNTKNYNLVVTPILRYCETVFSLTDNIFHVVNLGKWSVP